MLSPEQTFRPPEFSAPDKGWGEGVSGIPEPDSEQLPTQHASSALVERSELGNQAELLPERRALSYGELFSKNAFWVFRFLQGIGYTKYLRELANMEGIDFEAGLEELRTQGFLDESDSARPGIEWSKLIAR